MTLATLKFSVREGLVRGRATAPNQAVYDESHVERVRLIVVLSTTAGRPLGTALYEPAILALRRLVHADIALRASET